MLFDLRSGKRRRVVQVVFGFLAFLFFISFVGFGIGSDVSGGIFDALGLTDGGGSSSTADQYEQQIEDAEEQVAADPKDQGALLDVARYRFLSGQSQLEADESGAPVLGEQSRQEFEQAIVAWEDYLKTDPKRADPSVAGQVVLAYDLLADPEGAARAQQVLVESNPSAGTYGTLAYYLYAGGQIERADEAADEAIAAAPKAEQKKLERQFDALSKQATELEKQLAKTPPGGATGEGTLDSPFGGLGEGATAP